MKTKILLLLMFLVSLSAIGQSSNTQGTIIRKKCTTCGKPLSQCKGHQTPKPNQKTCNTCGKIISKCQYKGAHPKQKPMLSTGYENGHEWIDLGLSVKWATCNIGASSPSDYGEYYFWGETDSKSKKNKWFNPTTDAITKYCIDPKDGIVDNKFILDLSDDAAHINWGGSWRIPTKAEIDELRMKCIWKWTVQNGVKGYKVISKRNGNSIFLPAASSGWHKESDLGKRGEYMSSTLDTEHSTSVCGLQFSPVFVETYTFYRKFTNPTVRAICPDNGHSEFSINQHPNVLDAKLKSIPPTDTSGPTTGISNGHEWVDLGLSVKWATCNVGATSQNDYGFYFAWGETNVKNDYSWNTYKLCHGTYNSMTKYVTDSEYGEMDNKRELDLSDDAANVNWGGNWRMPTEEEVNELIKQCTWEWTCKNEVNGYTVIGKNGNSIFLPASGWQHDREKLSQNFDGYYWSSSLGTIYNKATYFYFSSSRVFLHNYNFRNAGHCVRAVIL